MAWKNIEARKAYDQKWKHKHREKITAQQRIWNKLHGEKSRYKYAYGIPPEKYEEVVHRSKTENCEICGGSPARVEHQSGARRLHVDHPRGEKRMRGLLCHFCNCGLGNFKDSIENLQRAIEYLRADSERRVSP